MSSQKAISKARSLQGLFEKIKQYYRHYFPSMYEKLSDDEKKIFDNLYPELTAKAKFADTFSDISATCGAYFGTVYIGVELSNMLGLIAVGSLFGVVAFGLMLFSLLTWVVSNVYHLVFVERERERILDKNKEGLQTVFESIYDLKKQSKELSGDLDELKSYFKRTVDVSLDETHQCVARACLEYINYASNLLGPDVLQVIIDGMTYHVDYEQGIIPDSEEKKNADKALEMTKYFSNSIKFSSDPASKETMHGINDDFMRSWSKLVGKMPCDRFQPGDAHKVHLEYLQELTEIGSALPLLKEIVHSMSSGQDITNLSDVLRPELQQSLRHYPITTSSMTNDSVEPALSASDRPHRLLPRPVIDVPKIVASALVDASESKKSSTYDGPTESIRDLRVRSRLLRDDLANLGDYFDQVVSIDSEITHRHVASACQEYIKYATELLSPDVIQIISNGMLFDREHHAKRQSKEKKRADQAMEMTDYLSESIQFSPGSASASEKKGSMLKAIKAGVDAEFMKSWMKLVGHMPCKRFQPSDAERIHLEYLQEVTEISSAIPLLKAMAYSIQVGQDITHLADAFYPALQQTLKHHPIFQPSSSIDHESHSLSAQTRPDRLLRKPPIDVPRIAAKVFVDAAESKQAKRSHEAKIKLKPGFMQWFNSE